jgi:putative ABC transport system permease protein
MGLRDLAYAVKSLGRTPAFTLTALVVLALGIGANTAIFSLAHGVLLRPLPFADPDRLVRIWSSHDERRLPFFSVSLADYIDWRDGTERLEGMAAYERQQAITVPGTAEQLSVTRVSADLFPLLGVAPELGRVLTAGDHGTTRTGVAVISHALWQRQFGGRHDVLGRSLALDEDVWTIVGVMPARFGIPNAPSDVWLPLPSTSDGTPRSARRFLRVLGRLRAGVGVEDARDELALIAARLSDAYPASNRGWGVAVRPLIDTVVSPEFRRSVVLLVGAVVFVLLMACANVTGLLLTRATARRREMAVRTALGASRRALIGLLLVESLVLAVTAGGLGLLLAAWGLDALKIVGTDSVPRLDEVGLSAPVFAFAAAVTLATATLFGIGPALYASRGMADALRARESAADAQTSRGRHLLIVAEVALAMVLLVGAGLMIRSFVQLQQRPLGFDSASLLLAALAPPAATGDRVDLTVTTRMVQERLAQLPGVEVAAAGSSPPFAGSNSGDIIEREGLVVPREQAPDADYRVVTPAYLRALGIPLLRGRAFTDQDGPAAPAAILSAETARRYWPDRDPVGTRLRLGGSPWMAIVGIAGDVRYGSISEPGDAVRPMVYVPHTQMPATPMTMVVKTRVPPETLAESVRAAIREAAPASPVIRIDTMAAILAQARGPQRFATLVLAVFAWVATVLAAAGVYGLLAYLVGRRTKEIGVRVALGATAMDVVRLTAGGGIVLAIVGVAIGLAASLALAGVLRGVLFDVSVTDPLTYVVVTIGLLGVTAAASYFPARRALRINPIDALRTE